MNPFDCTQVQLWIDAGGPAPGAASAAAHAAGCPDCTSLLAADRAVTALLAVPAPAALPRLDSPGFVDRVMAQVGRTPQVREIPRVVLAPAQSVADALPWWVRVAARRETVLASLLAGAVLLSAPQLLAFARGFSQWGPAAREGLGLALPLLAPPAARLAGDPLVEAGVALAFLPLIGLLAYALYLLGTQVARVRLAPALRPGRRA